MDNKEITLEERKRILYDMLVEIDGICREHNLKYSLSSGTLIGAIRHKGFIPWDDDLDIMMPYEDILELQKNLPTKTLQYCDAFVDDNYEATFPRLAYRPTFRLKMKNVPTYGISIDLYPFFQLKYDNIEDVYALLKAGKRASRIRQKADSIRIRLSKFLPFKKMPFFNAIVKWSANYPIKAKGSGKYYFAHGGFFSQKTIFEYDLFSNMSEYQFEGRNFMGIANYDDYLTHLYGDYMTPPPESKRIANHSGHYYWR